MQLPSRLTEISFTRSGKNPKHLAELCDLLEDAGLARSDMVFSELKEKQRLSCYLIDSKIIRKIANLARRRNFSWKTKTRVLGTDDWLNKWKQSYRITPLGQKFAVVPEWERESYKGRRVPVILDPEAAFGSGTHETTRLMVREMERLEGRFESFFDAGTGSGILCVIAAALGAERIEGLDHDSDSVKTAKRNLKINGVKAVLSAKDMLKAESKNKFDLVGANMISGTLTRVRPALTALCRPGGRVLVSGVSRKNLPGFLKEFQVPELRRVRTVQGRSWAACLFKKRK